MEGNRKERDMDWGEMTGRGGGEIGRSEKKQ
jgi:hypothetical protein